MSIPNSPNSISSGTSDPKQSAGVYHLISYFIICYGIRCNKGGFQFYQLKRKADNITYITQTE